MDIFGKILNINMKFEKDKIIVLNDGKITKKKFGTGLSNLQKIRTSKIGSLRSSNFR